jgi:hypothetical protein
LRASQDVTARFLALRPPAAGLGDGQPSDYDDLMRRAGGVWEPGARQWLVERRRIGPVLCELERSVDPLFRRVGIHLE